MVASAGGVVREIQISQAAAEITYEYRLEAVVERYFGWE